MGGRYSACCSRVEWFPQSPDGRKFKIVTLWTFKKSLVACDVIEGKLQGHQHRCGCQFLGSVVGLHYRIASRGQGEGNAPPRITFKETHPSACALWTEHLFLDDPDGLQGMVVGSQGKSEYHPTVYGFTPELPLAWLMGNRPNGEKGERGGGWGGETKQQVSPAY